MSTFTLILVLLVCVLISAVVDQFVPKVSLPLIQIVLGLIASIFVSASEVDIEPEFFLVIFIAPLLFDEARRTDVVSLWRSRGSMVSLAVGLVIVAVLVIGFTLNWLVPSIPLAAAFALGAALGPTDAVAVSSLSSETAMTNRQKSLLKNEYLINDASGIVSFQFAVAAVTTGAFSLLDATVSFLINFFGGIAIGVLLGFVAVFIRRWVRNAGIESTTFHVLFEIMVPFGIFLLAEQFETSGILAVVAAGLVFSAMPQEFNPSTSQTNIVSNSVWRVITFVLNGLVFVLLGVQLPSAMQATWQDASISNFTLIALVFLITFIMMAVRFLWLLVMERIHIRDRLRAQNVREVAATTFAGSKGAITLSIAMSLPFYISLSPPTPFPSRSLIIFLASGVIILTLLAATFLVPILMPPPKEEKEGRQQFAAAQVEILRRVITELTSEETDENKGAVLAAINARNKRIKDIQEDHDLETESSRQIRLQAYQWQQERIYELMDAEEIDLQEGNKALQRLDYLQDITRQERLSLLAIMAQRLYRWRIMFRAWFHHLRHRAPLPDPSEEEEESRHIRREALEHAISKLEDEMAHPDIGVNAENIGRVLLEYQQQLALINNPVQRTADAASPSSPKSLDVERRALGLELQYTRDMQEEGSISRDAARRLVENIHLMQLDLASQG
ncbi:MAG: Na+/H+ antiporter [Coriobacteriaceae bacterium]|nr:Na+/H+ antiporter [Coriobacteriaceae bacterium]